MLDGWADGVAHLRYIAKRRVWRTIDDMAGQDQTTQACAYLRMLLLRPGIYRQRWARWAPDTPPGEIDHDAVAHVLNTLHPTLAGLSAWVVVREALTGVVLNTRILEWFIDGFGFSPRHAGRLRDVFAGSPATRVISGDMLPPAELEQRSVPLGYETLALHELHTLGPDGTPAEHQTIQVIRSTVDRLESYPYRFDTDQLTVEVTRGGQVGDRVYRVASDLYGVDILLTQPLSRGEAALLQYRTTFCYDTPPLPEFRRGLLRPTKDVSIWVRFHPDRLPATVTADRWDGLDHERIVEREPVELDEEHSVHRRFDQISRAVVGFSWSWS